MALNSEGGLSVSLDYSHNLLIEGVSVLSLRRGLPRGLANVARHGDKDGDLKGPPRGPFRLDKPLTMPGMAQPLTPR